MDQEELLDFKELNENSSQPEIDTNEKQQADESVEPQDVPSENVDNVELNPEAEESTEPQDVPSENVDNVESNPEAEEETQKDDSGDADHSNNKQEDINEEETEVETIDNPEEQPHDIEEQKEKTEVNLENEDNEVASLEDTTEPHEDLETGDQQEIEKDEIANEVEDGITDEPITEIQSEEVNDSEKKETEQVNADAEGEGSVGNEVNDVDQVTKDQEENTEEGEEKEENKALEEESSELQEVEGMENPVETGMDKSSSTRPAEETQDEMLLTQDTRIEESSRMTNGAIGLVPHPTMATGQGTELIKDEEVIKSEGDTGTATVKFVLMPSGHVITKALPLSTDNSGLILSVALDIKLSPQYVQILFNGVVMVEEVTLSGLGIETNGIVAFEVMSTDPDQHPIKTPPQMETVGMSDVITVKVPYEDGSFKETIVEIDRVKRKKIYLGGYRHKKTGVEFYHASAQTYGPVRPPPVVERFSRDTQTVEQKHTVQQTFNTTSTQMTRPGFYESNLDDKLIIPHKYETADEFKARMLKKVVIVQTYYRRWLAQKRVNHLRSKRDAREDYEKDLELKKRREKEERIERELERRMNPKTKEDFDLLYDALEKWRQEEINRINSTLTGAERKAALCVILDQETELIAAIDRHQLDASAANKEKGIQKLLGKAAASKAFKSKTGHTIKVDTAYTLRGKELLEIYNSLNMKYLTQDERLDVLLTLKHTVKEHDCKLTHEIVELIDREADLLMRGVKEDNLNGLRKRISTLFLQYCKTPTFNPEITHLLKVPQDPSSLKNDVNYCNSCGRYLPATAFNLGIQSDSLGKCRSCLRKDNIARIRQDQSFYRHLLHNLRKEEEHYSDNAKIAFLIEEADLRYLVENMWNSKSILSSWDDQADLEMVRWRIEEEWSPWNCVYLTRDEAESHRKIKKLTEAYGDMLMHKVDQKHVIASNHFVRLRKIAGTMQNTLKIQGVPEHKSNNHLATSA